MLKEGRGVRNREEEDGGGEWGWEKGKNDWGHVATGLSG